MRTRGSQCPNSGAALATTTDDANSTTIPALTPAQLQKLMALLGNQGTALDPPFANIAASNFSG